jgi:hypothetical protein
VVRVVGREEWWEGEWKERQGGRRASQPVPDGNGSQYGRGRGAARGRLFSGERLSSSADRDVHAQDAGVDTRL